MQWLEVIAECAIETRKGLEVAEEEVRALSLAQGAREVWVCSEDGRLHLLEDCGPLAVS